MGYISMNMAVQTWKPPIGTQRWIGQLCWLILELRLTLPGGIRQARHLGKRPELTTIAFWIVPFRVRLQGEHELDSRSS